MPKSLKTQEVGFYYADDHVLAGKLVAQLCSRYPVHSVFGERPEMVYVARCKFPGLGRNIERCSDR